MTDRTRRCSDCGESAAVSIFDGAGAVECCAPCARGRAAGAVPEWRMGPGVIVGHAAATNQLFEQSGRAQMFGRGAFRSGLAVRPDVALTVNHIGCLCGYDGNGWKAADGTDRGTALLDWPNVLAFTGHDSLWLWEDLHGLFFVAKFRDDAHWGDASISDLVSRGECRGLSVHAHGGRRYAEPADVWVWSTVHLQEISLILPPLEQPGSPGTWVMPGGPAAMDRLYTELRAAAADEGNGYAAG